MKNQKNRTQRNNKGFSVVLVILSMSVVLLLVSTILYAVYQNYIIKQNNLKSEDSFYSAEKVLDEIKAGLQTDMSEAVSVAYNYVLERYSETEGQDETRNWYFQTKYVDTLRARLLDAEASGENGDAYAESKLASYVTSVEAPENVKITNTILEQAVKARRSKDSIDINYDKGVTLRGIKIEYTDENGYYTAITTDLCLGIPDIQFTQTSTAPDLLSFALIAKDNLNITEAGNRKILGNTYAGEINIGNAAQLEIADATEQVRALQTATVDRVIVDGPINVNNNGTNVGSRGESFVFDGTALWAQSVNVNGATVSMDGNVFIQDDMTLTGRGSNVTLEGSYYGFSNPDRINQSFSSGDAAEEANESSAIVINGKDSSLDFSGLNSLLLSGNTYVNTPDSISPLMMGESIAVKSNQLMYLAPASTVQITSADGAYYKTGNPITNITGEISVTLKTDVPVTTLGGKTLAKLGIGALDCQVCHIAGKNTAYVYMKLNKDQAAAYIEAYYNGSASAKLQEYMGLYIEEIQINEDAVAQFRTNGNILTKGKLYQSSIYSDMTDDLAEEENIYHNMFQALTKKLVTDSKAVSNEEKTSDVFNNLINVDKFRTFVTSKGGEFTFKTPAGIQGVLCTGTYEIDKSSSESKISLVIALGDVVVENGVKFDGLILSNGTVTLGANASVTGSPEKVASIFQCVYDTAGQEVKDGEELIAPMSFFYEGEEYILSSIASGAIRGEAGQLIDVADYIVYENWKKL